VEKIENREYNNKETRQIHEKKCEYNEAVYQLFIDFKEYYFSVIREIL
jgi:hypothetical protein